mmetsp:Transcript_26939/g.54495  ORF Transcript_26939/g.54495 Transcript_26939/m.54495 type:complete len:99 (-) Transcript_26939:76-372(-)
MPGIQLTSPVTGFTTFLQEAALLHMQKAKYGKRCTYLSSPVKLSRSAYRVSKYLRNQGYAEDQRWGAPPKKNMHKTVLSIPRASFVRENRNTSSPWNE